MRDWVRRETMEGLEIARGEHLFAFVPKYVVKHYVLDPVLRDKALALVKAGDHEAAWRRLTADNPFPAIHGRVCYHPCETACNRAQLDEAVGINSV